MMFLHADCYAPKDAAKQMVHFFELKKSLFGAEKLVKVITLDDLDKDDICFKQVASNLVLSFPRRHWPALVLALPHPCSFSLALYT